MCTGSKRINISDITAIQFKESAGVTIGFIQFVYPGSGEARGGVIDDVNDENVIPVSLQNLAVARENVDFIEKKWAGIAYFYQYGHSSDFCC